MTELPSDVDEAPPRGTVADRIKNTPGRTKGLIVLGLVLLVLGLTGVLQASSGVEVDRSEAIELARTEIDFEPTQADARFVRQGFALQPIWAVSFSIPSTDGGRDDFDRLTIVEVDAVTGEIVNVSDETGDSPDSEG